MYFACGEFSLSKGKCKEKLDDRKILQAQRHRVPKAQRDVRSPFYLLQMNGFSKLLTFTSDVYGYLIGTNAGHDQRSASLGQESHP